MVDTPGREALNLARTTTRCHILHAKPWLVVWARTVSVPLRYVPVDVALRLETSSSHIQHGRTKPGSIARRPLVSNSIVLCRNLLSCVGHYCSFTNPFTKSGNA